MVMVFLTELEPEMSYRAVCHSSRKEVIRRASLEYPDARTRSDSRAGSKQLFVLCSILER
eukprot:6344533-Pyramimonas_sp.AAC.1